MCLLGLLPALTVPMTLPCLAGNNAELPPNIIVVLTDDMGYGDIGIYGGKFIPTPNIDRMAEEGSRFNQYYSASPISSPSRCGLPTDVPGQVAYNHLFTRKGWKQSCGNGRLFGPFGSHLAQSDEECRI